MTPMISPSVARACTASRTAGNRFSSVAAHRLYILQAGGNVSLSRGSEFSDEWLRLFTKRGVGLHHGNAFVLVHDAVIHADDFSLVLFDFAKYL